MTTIKELETKYNRFKRSVALVFLTVPLGLTFLMFELFLPYGPIKFTLTVIGTLLLGIGVGAQLIMAATILGEPRK